MKNRPLDFFFRCTKLYHRQTIVIQTFAIMLDLHHNKVFLNQCIATVHMWIEIPSFWSGMITKCMNQKKKKKKKKMFFQPKIIFFLFHSTKIYVVDTPLIWYFENVYGCDNSDTAILFAPKIAKQLQFHSKRMAIRARLFKASLA